MTDGVWPTRRELLGATGVAATGLVGCVDAWRDCDSEPVDVPDDTWTHPNADAAGTGAVEGSVTRLAPRFVAESDGVYGTPVADRSGIYSGSGHGIYAFDHDGAKRWVTGGQLSALESPPTRVIRGGSPPVVVDEHVVVNVLFKETGGASTVLAGLYVIGADGERRWTMESWEGQPLVGDGGRIYHLEHSSRSLRRKSPDADHNQDRARVRAFDLRTGKRCWSHDRTVLDLGSEDDLFGATEPLVGALREDELVVVSNDARTIRSLDRESGEIRGEWDVSFRADAPPTIVDGVLYTRVEEARGALGHGPTIVAYDLDRGEVAWSYSPSPPPKAFVRWLRPAPYAVGDGVLVWVGPEETVGLAADDGERLWSTGRSEASPTIVGDTVLLVEDGGASLVCRDLDSGAERHRATTAGSFGPCIASGGNVYVLREGDRPGIVTYGL